jgi:hypothetical protein
MILSSFWIFIPAIVLESFIQKPSVWEALLTQWLMIFVIIGGVFLTLVYQSSVVAVTSQTKAISVGVLHQLIMFNSLF